MTLIEAYEKTPLTMGVIDDFYRYGTGHGDEIPYLEMAAIGAIDNMYYLMHSGNKYISPYLEKMLEFEFPTQGAWKFLVGRDLYEMYKQQLLKEWERFVVQYNPSTNYSVTEIVDYDHTGSSGMTDSGTDTKLRSGVIQNYGRMHSQNSANTYDGVTATETTKNETWSDEEHEPSTTRYGNGTTGSGVTDATTYGKSRTGSESGHDDLTTTKAGNLGITPIAQLLQMDIELWKLNFYRDIMFPLFDKTLVLPIY